MFTITQQRSDRIKPQSHNSEPVLWKDKTMDTEQSVKWAGIWGKVPVIEENGTFKRKVGQKLWANMVGVEDSMG